MHEAPVQTMTDVSNEVSDNLSVTPTIHSRCISIIRSSKWSGSYLVTASLVSSLACKPSSCTTNERRLAYL